ncbi:MAG TPA: cytochrome d ubiquinol oxidase subunit II [Jatrophihabitantaceae bacterium]|jgi:cytochrome d ubiquinol oxidase subunit II
MTLTTFWFFVIGVVWAGFFVLDGFDLGVGMLHGFVGRDEDGRRAAISAIAPVWDGNEVWLVVGAAGMFAAFPQWYATTFSALYLVVVVLLAALILRGVAFEFGAKVRDSGWRRRWSWLLALGSLVIPVLLGLVLGDLLAGLPIDSSGEFTGSFADLITGYGVFVGITFAAMCLVHGALFLAIKCTGTVAARAGRAATWLALPGALVVTAYAIWTHVIAGKGVLPNILEVMAILAAFATAWAAVESHFGWAFVAMAATIATAVLSLFADLYPRVMVSTLGSGNDLTVTGAASGSYALTLMTIIVAVFLPVVLLYQGWTYHVFRARIRTGGAPPDDAEPATPGPSPNGGSVRATRPD